MSDREIFGNTVQLRDGRVLIIPTPEEDDQITKAALSDPDAQPLTEEQVAEMTPVCLRGRPVGSGNKIQVTVQFDIDIVDYFKRSGEGWQTRMNDALRDWVASH